MYLKNFNIFANAHDGFATFRDSAFQMRVFLFDFFQLSFALLKFRLKIHVDQIVIVLFRDYLSKIWNWKELKIEEIFLLFNVVIFKIEHVGFAWYFADLLVNQLIGFHDELLLLFQHRHVVRRDRRRDLELFWIFSQRVRRRVVFDQYIADVRLRAADFYL